MKIRNGFVSNSSTSSFILIGNKITKEKAFDDFLKAHPEYSSDEDDYLEDEFFDWASNGEGNVVYVEDAGYFEGEFLATWSDEEGLSERHFDIKKMLEKFKDMENVKLYCGTYPS